MEYGRQAYYCEKNLDVNTLSRLVMTRLKLELSNLIGPRTLSCIYLQGPKIMLNACFVNIEKYQKIPE